jgi:hypothetical protein
VADAPSALEQHHRNVRAGALISRRRDARLPNRPQMAAVTQALRSSKFADRDASSMNGRPPEVDHLIVWRLLALMWFRNPGPA